MLYKFTKENGETRGGFRWSLPTKNEDGTWTPGEWMEVYGEIVPCENALHLTLPEYVARLCNKEMYAAEFAGEHILHVDNNGKKIVCRKARLTRRIEAWDDRIMRLFAVRCARDAMSYVNDPDPRSVAAIDTAERYANGNATDSELGAAQDAALEAVWEAARESALGAAQDAARYAARYAAWDTALGAAQDAALGAAQDAAWDAAINKYSSWLLEMVGE